AITALKKGAHLLKYGRRGKPKFCPFRLSNRSGTIGDYYDLSALLEETSFNFLSMFRFFSISENNLEIEFELLSWKNGHTMNQQGVFSEGKHHFTSFIKYADKSLMRDICRQIKKTLCSYMVVLLPQYTTKQSVLGTKILQSM
ncbi:hypothetical protein KI387_020507, partial [Taxus chinensis]